MLPQLPVFRCLSALDANPDLALDLVHHGLDQGQSHRLEDF